MTVLHDLGSDVLDGVPEMANPMPGAAPPPTCGSSAANVGTPITWPDRFTSAPPLLPGLIAALVCSTSGRVAPGPSPAGSLTVRPTAEMIPSVTLPDRPSGLPIASTMSPIRSWSESPNVAGANDAGGSSN